MDAIALIGTAWLAFYVTACAVWPYRSCARCSGTGKRRSPSGKAWRAGAVTALDARSGWAGGWWSGCSVIGLATTVTSCSAGWCRTRLADDLVDQAWLAGDL